MIPKEVLKRVKKIEIRTRNLVSEMFAGEYHSVFKGRGIEFTEVREYQFGDDIRNIDWNVTAKMTHPYVKKYCEERELTVILVIDASSSNKFGTVAQMKSEIGIEISALLAFSAIKNNDRVGLIIFTDKVEKFVPPKKGKKHVLRVLRELLYFKPSATRTDINCALEYLSHIIRKKAVVFLISDFLAKDYATSLKIANKRHDVIAINIIDPREIELPDVGFIELKDAETQEDVLIDTSDISFRNTFRELNLKKQNQLNKLFGGIGVDSIDIWTNKSYVEPLMNFFIKRAKRFR
ncbi:MAG: DUF58 domain-containing protein [bacterium]